MRSKNRIKISNYLLVVVCGLFLVTRMSPAAEPNQDQSQEELVFGFLPVLSTQKLFTRFAPLVDHLAKELGQPIRMETAPDYATFLKRTNDQRYDIIFTAPHFYYLAKKNAGYRIVARVAGKELKATIVARKDSGIKSVRDLKGKKLATPDALSLGSVLVKNTLLQHGLQAGKDITLVATPSHNASLLLAYYGTTDAASLMIPPYNRAPLKVRSSMVKITDTQGAPNMPICVARRVPGTISKKLQHALVNLTTTKAGRKLLKHLSWSAGFTRTSFEEYKHLDWVIQQIKISE